VPLISVYQFVGSAHTGDLNQVTRRFRAPLTLDRCNAGDM